MDQARRWIVRSPDPRAADLAAKLRTSPILAQILLNRGITEVDDAARFLRPSLTQLHAPALLANLPRAAERIAEAIRQRSRIVIFGDYDVDGITGTAILWHAIRLLGGDVGYYIPHRVEEGYGLKPEAMRAIRGKGAELIISVDCGITAIEAVKAACDDGAEVIVSDHHEWTPDPATGGALLPECHAVVHPRLPGHTPYPNPDLCGAGVALKLAWGVGLAMAGAEKVAADFRDFLVNATAMAALGTIADVVPLRGENRALAHFGLKHLVQSRLFGIQSLIASAGLAGKNLDSEHVAFRLAPRLNACGRMGHARLAVELMTDADEKRSAEIAQFLGAQNVERQRTERSILDQAIEQIKANGFDRDDCRGIVLGSEKWHPGVIGIVASRIVDRYHRPTVLVAMTNGHGAGSGRSIAGFNLAEALLACGDHLEHHGGHAMAAGLGMASARLESFRTAFIDHANQRVSVDQLQPTLEIDAEATLREMTLPLVLEMQRLGPFGQGNRQPILACRGVEATAPAKPMGTTAAHASFYARADGATLRCIGFSRGSLVEWVRPGIRLDLAFVPIVNTYQNRQSVELHLRDIRRST